MTRLNQHASLLRATEHPTLSPAAQNASDRLKALPTTDALMAMRDFLHTADLGDVDVRATDQLDVGLAECLRQSRADDAVEQQRLFGCEVVS